MTKFVPPTHLPVETGSHWVVCSNKDLLVRLGKNQQCWFASWSIHYWSGWSSRMCLNNFVETANISQHWKGFIPHCCHERLSTSPTEPVGISQVGQVGFSCTLGRLKYPKQSIIACISMTPVRSLRSEWLKFC